MTFNDPPNTVMNRARTYPMIDAVLAFYIKAAKKKERDIWPKPQPK